MLEVTATAAWDEERTPRKPRYNAEDAGYYYDSGYYEEEVHEEPMKLDLRLLKRYLGAIVEVHLVDGSVIRGRLVSFDSDYLNVLLEEAETKDGRRVPAALICGASISHILFVGPPKVKEKLEDKVLELLRKDPNLDPETIARLCGARVDRVKEIMANLRRKGLIRDRA